MNVKDQILFQKKKNSSFEQKKKRENAKISILKMKKNPTNKTSKIHIVYGIEFERFQKVIIDKHCFLKSKKKKSKFGV